MRLVFAPRRGGKAACRLTGLLNALYTFLSQWTELLGLPFLSQGSSTNGDDQSAGPQAAPAQYLQERLPGVGQLPAASWRVHPCVHHHAEEAELRAPQGREGPLDQWFRGHLVHWWRRPQPAGTLRGPDPWRPRQGSSRRALSHRARFARRL